MTFKMQSKNAITLISLVVTIIVLLILTGVALTTLTGENGIVNRAITSRELYDLSSAKEQVDILAAAYSSNYYYEKYTKDLEISDNVGDYVSEKLNSDTNVGNYTIKTYEKLIVIKNGNNVASGKIQNNGSVIWDKKTFNPDLIKLGNESTPVDVDKYGLKVTNYTSKYEEDNDIVLGWRLFYKDKNFAYLICDTLIGSYKPSDYYEKYSDGSKVSIVGQKLNSMICAAPSFFSNTNQTNAIKATAWLTDTQYWDDYIDKDRNALYAIGSPTAELFTASFNATAIGNNTDPIPIYRFSNGYKNSDAQYKIESLYTSYNNGIYRKRDSAFWIASPDHWFGCLWYVNGSGWLYKAYVDQTSMSVRPIVCFPASEINDSVLANQ